MWLIVNPGLDEAYAIVACSITWPRRWGVVRLRLGAKIRGRELGARRLHVPLQYLGDALGARGDLATPAPKMTKRGTYGLIPLLVLIAGLLPMGPPTRIEIVSDIDQLAQVFAATVAIRDDVIQITLRPTPKWRILGKFMGYTLRVSPGPIEDIARAHEADGYRWIVRHDQSPTATMEVPAKDVKRAYVVARFIGGAKGWATPTDVVIPAVLLQGLAKRSNPVAAPLSGVTALPAIPVSAPPPVTHR